MNTVLRIILVCSSCQLSNWPDTTFYDLELLMWVENFQTFVEWFCTDISKYRQRYTYLHQKVRHCHKPFSAEFQWGFMLFMMKANFRLKMYYQLSSSLSHNNLQFSLSWIEKHPTSLFPLSYKVETKSHLVKSLATLTRTSSYERNIKFLQ